MFSMRKANMINLQTYYRLCRCSVARPPKRYGLPKLHKPQMPMRPIVSSCGSPTYELSKHLTTVLQPRLTNKSQHKLQSTENFIDAIKTVQTLDEYKLVSFDVKSLFTSIPLQLALDCTKTVSHWRSTDELLYLYRRHHGTTNTFLNSTYLQCNSTHHKQLHGTAMGSPVSVVVAEIVMQSIEEPALAIYQRTLPFWFRYVDDTITVHYNRTTLKGSTTTLTNRTVTYNLPKRSKRMEQFLF